MGNVYVGIGEYSVSNDASTVIRTLGLGSCVGIIAYSAKARAGGLLHIALPESGINPQRAAQKPGIFADTGLPLFLEALSRLGANLPGGLIIKLAGGASIMDSNQIFNIGKRNQLAVRKILWANRLGAIAEDTGGQFSRSVSLDIATGRVVLSSPGRGEWEL
jgi:chemotaxis protein CheD